MFILVQPMYSKKELNADSNYVVYTTLIRGMLDVRPDWHFFVLFPDNKSDHRYKDDGFFRLPNVTRIPQRIATRKFANAISYNAEWYDQLFKRLGIDIVWCNLVEIAGHIREAGETSDEWNCKPLVVAAHNYVIHDSLPYGLQHMEVSAIMQIMGGLLADHNVFNSDWCRIMLEDTARKWFKESVIDEINAKSTKINYGCLDPDIQPTALDHAPDRTPIIAYNHRLQAYKNWRDTFALFEALHNEGVDFRVRYMSNTAENLSFIQDKPFVEVCLTETHAEYVAALAECDLNVTNSQHETFCIAAIESMAYGQPLVAPRGVTFPEITGATNGNGYPFLFKSKTQQKDMVAGLLKDFTLRRKWGAVVSDHVRSNYNRVTWAEEYAALFERLTGDVKLGTPADTRAFALDVLRRHSGEEIHVLRGKLSGKKVNGRIPFGTQSLTCTKTVRLIRELGGSVKMIRGRQRAYVK